MNATQHDLLEEARKVVALRGDTYSSYEVVGLVGRMAAEIERLRAERDDLKERMHYANGAYALALKHRDAAEAEREELLAALKFSVKEIMDYEGWLNAVRATIAKAEGRK